MLLVAAACVTVGLIGFGTQREDEHFQNAAVDKYVNSLVEHQKYNAEQMSAVDELIQEGKKNMKDT